MIVSFSFRNVANNPSLKHTTFVNSPMAGKLVTEIPGIGPALGEELRMKEFVYATQILGQYLVFSQDEKKFRDWLKLQCGIGDKQCRSVYIALQEWSQHYL